MIRLAAIMALVLLPAMANAASQDSDWPCQQIKVSALSLAAVWSGPDVDPQQSEWKNDQQVVDLVHQITPRRIPIEHAQGLIHNFAQQAGGAKQTRLLQVLAGVFTVLDTERDTLIAGLDRFGERQKQLAAGIRTDNEKLRTLQNDQKANPATVQQMVQQVTWEAELFQDRRQAISYACEAPAKIEQRLFGLSHAIQQELE